MISRFASILPIVVLMASSAQAAPQTWSVASPDGNVTFGLALGADGSLTYTVHLERGSASDEVVAASPLGVQRDDQAFIDRLHAVGAAPARTIDETYTALHGKRRTVHHHAREQVFSFANATGAPMDLVVQVANDGVAFRYRFPNRDATWRRVVDEVTGFSIPAGARGWMLPRQPPGKYSPAYENLFIDVTAGDQAPTPSGWSLPALFSVGGGRDWVLVSEAGLDESYCGSRLDASAPGGRYRLRLPQPEEGQGVGTVDPRSPLPWTLPWRVLIVSPTPAGIAESTLVDDVSPPSVVADTSWIQPGRVSWSWWSDDDSPRDEKALDAFVDLAADMGWEYSLIDANWNLMAPEALQRVLAHAREKHIGILLWYNSGGPHNVVTEQPRDRMHQREIRRREFETLQKWGVRGVKVDFWQSDKQDRIQQYLDLLRDAADYHLMVDFHGCTVPRGWSRTYPHLMTQEAVPGAEQYKFNKDYAAKAPWHNTVLAFTRNVVGGMDFTPVTFSDHKFPHQTSNAHELALSVVFESGLQHFADSVTSYESLDEPVRAFLSHVPAAWLETRLVGGEPGRLAVFARRAADGWYVGGISGLDAPQSFDLKLSFLGAGRYHAAIVTDGDGPRDLKASSREVTAADSMPFPLVAHGGFVVRLTEE